jgi:hypothetical protein
MDTSHNLLQRNINTRVQSMEHGVCNNYAAHDDGGVVEIAKKKLLHTAPGLIIPRLSCSLIRLGELYSLYGLYSTSTRTPSRFLHAPHPSEG